MSNYDDIIHLPHYVSKTRPQMSMIERAAQFSPFAALSGYDAAIAETRRLTDEKIVLDDEELVILNMRLQIIQEKLCDNPHVTFTYFKPDERKVGGAYVKTAGVVKKIDDIGRLVVMRDGKKIPIEDIIDIACESIPELMGYQ